MTMSRFRSGSLLLATLLMAALGLTACVQVPEQGGSASGARPTRDIHTASDDSEVRRRARIRLELATTYYQQGQLTTALDELKQAESIDPRLPATHELRALIYDAMGDAERAEASFRRAMDLDPSNGSVMHNYAWYLCGRTQYAAADSLFARAMAFPMTVDTSRTLLARGVCQMRAGLFAEAEKTLLASYEVDSGNPATAYNLATVLHRRGELERARFYVRRVNNVAEQVTADSLWLAARIEHRLGNIAGRNELGSQLRTRFPASREATALELGRFDE